MDQKSEIGIIGGGPGGLTLARILQTKGFKGVKIYEQEESREVRGQGGTLDLHTETGQYALNVAGLLDLFNALCRREGEDMRILDSKGNVLLEEIGSSNGRPEIDRSQLRDLLLDSLDPGTVQWGHSLTSLRESADGKVELSFKNGRKIKADFVVGADGAWSKVRPILSPAVPTYSSISFMEFTLTSNPDLDALVGRGSMFSFGGGKGIIAQRNSGDVIRIYAALCVPQDWIKSFDLDVKDFKAVKKFLLAQFAEWDESLTNTIKSNEREFIPRLIFALPVEHSWTLDPKNSLQSKVTLLGDAAHVMSPFAGEGVNLAMTDAASLALALSKGGSLESAVRKYEREMFRRSKSAAVESAGNLELSFGPRGSHAMKEKFDEYNSWAFYIKCMFYMALEYGRSWLPWNW